MTTIIDPALALDYSWRDIPDTTHELPCETGLHFWTIEGFARTYHAFGGCFACDAPKLWAQTHRVYRRRRNIAAACALLGCCLFALAPASLIAVAVALWICFDAAKTAHICKTALNAETAKPSCHNLECLHPIHMDYQSAFEATRLKLGGKYSEVEVIPWYRIPKYLDQSEWKVMCIDVSGKPHDVLHLRRKGDQAEVVYRNGVFRQSVPAEDIRSCIALKH